MTTYPIKIKDLKKYINAAFCNDMDILKFYDQSVKVQSIEDVCENIYLKIKDLEDNISIKGISIQDEIVGFIAYQPELLVSFGLMESYRNEEDLKGFWDEIKLCFNGDFGCLLFSYNQRAIKWLQKVGMNKIHDNVSILTTCQLQQD